MHNFVFQELEKANDLLSQDCMKLQLEKKETLEHVDHLQKRSNDMDALKKDYEMSQEKFVESDANLKRLTSKVEQLTGEVRSLFLF